MHPTKAHFLVTASLLLLTLASCAPRPQVAPLVTSPSACNQATALEDAPLDSTFRQSAVLGGGLIRDGEFAFEAYLYCDPSLSPDAEAPQARTALDALGVHTAWRYEGPDLPGDVQLFWGFGQELQPSGGWDHGLTRGSMGSFTGGVSSQQAASAIVNGDPVHLLFAVKVGSLESGAILTFEFIPVIDGYTPTNILLEPQP